MEICINMGRFKNDKRKSKERRIDRDAHRLTIRSREEQVLLRPPFGSSKNLDRLQDFRPSDVYN
ncbi:hypothetical protein MUK42_17200 [Musa troglodytarum]|uniref:Uncharacterized protein n=1 Tax=Musa troglodytarum TaxID=320322 RepID=A0A9E7LB00_9LILI|nr:hypothetical protein MUK42_17200 [Musa troglodytarum]